MPAPRLRRKAVISEECDDEPVFSLPTWQSLSVDKIPSVGNFDNQPCIHFKVRNERAKQKCSQQMNRVKSICHDAKVFIQCKFESLRLLHEKIPQEEVGDNTSFDLTKEIDAILFRHHKDTFSSHVSTLNEEEEKKRENDELQSFAKTWNFSHIATKVISARRQLKGDRPLKSSKSQNSEKIINTIDSVGKEISGASNLDPEYDNASTSSVMLRAQEFVTNCMDAIVNVTSSLSEDALSSYPGAELTSNASVLGFELKSVAGSKHSRHIPDQHINNSTIQLTHQRMFFIVRFDLREHRKVQTTCTKQYGDADMDPLPDIISVSKSRIRGCISNNNSNGSVHTLRDRAKEVLHATDANLLQKARRRMRLESMQSVTVKRSLLALSAFHTALCVLLAAVDIDPPPFPDTFTFGAVEEAAIAHHQRQQLMPQPGLLARWFVGQSSSDNNIKPNSNKIAFSTPQQDVSVSPALSISSENFKEVCDQLQSYLNDVLALYEHLDEMLGSLPGGSSDIVDSSDDHNYSSAVQAIAMVADAKAHHEHSDTQIPVRAQRERAISAGLEVSNVNIDIPSNSERVTVAAPRVSKSTSDLPAEAEVMLTTTISDTKDGSHSNSSQHLWRIAASLAQLLRELFLASDTTESHIGNFIIRQNPSSSETAQMNPLAYNKTMLKVVQYQQQLLQQHQQGSLRTFWADCVPRTALIVRFSGGSFGSLPAAGEKAMDTGGSNCQRSVPRRDEVSCNRYGHGLGYDSENTVSSMMLTEDIRRGHQNLLKSYDEADLLRVQLSRCLGCGEILSSTLFGLGKNYSMCHYFGALFCQRWCHADDQRPIPMRVLHQWDCKPRKVCKLAAMYIDRVRNLPMVRIREANPLLLEGVPKLKRTMATQQMLRTSLLPRSLWADSETLLSLLSDLLPRRSHLILADGLFSLDDLLAVENERMRQLLQYLVEELMEFKTPQLPLSTPITGVRGY